MKKFEELSQRDVQKLETVKKMIGCSVEFRIKTISAIIKNVITNTFTDDDAQKTALMLGNKKLCVPECSKSYRILCETVISHSQAFDEDLVRKARSFAKANKLELNLPKKDVLQPTKVEA